MTDATANDSGEATGRMRSLLNASPVVVYCALPHAGFEHTFVSDNVERLIGFSARDILTRPGFWADRIHADDRGGCLAAHARAAERGHGVREYRVRHRNGRYIWIRDESLLSRDGHGLPREMTGSLIDISARKFSELYLRSSEARYRAVVEDQADPVCRFLPDATLTFVNGSYSRFRGLPAERLVGTSFLENVRESDRPDLRETLASLTPESPVGPSEHRADDSEGVSHWQAWTHHALFDERGELVEFQSVGRDITERRAAEELLARSNAELQQFAYVASHDLQEPLRTVSGFLQLLESRHGDRLHSEATEYIRLAMDGMERMRRLISDLLEYSRVRQDLAEFREVDLAVAVGSALRSLGAPITDAGAVVDVATLPSIRGDEFLIARLFQNLIGNAVKFRSPDRPPRIVVRAEIGAKTVTVEVSDNGVGFDPRFAERIFTMFARLHPRSKYEGTGIGLAVCRNIVEMHGGTIRAESEPGAGSSFFMSFPACHPMT